MIVSLALTLATPLALAPAAPSVRAPSPAPLVVPAQADHEAEIAAAGEDVAKLTALAEAWKEAGEDDAARAAWRRILELDENNEAAHKGLRHHLYDGKWFETYTALSKYRRGEEKRMAEKGLVRFRDEWVSKEELPYLRLGWVKDDKGKWASPAVLARIAEEAELIEAGYKPYDLLWVSPDEFDQWNAGKVPCGGEWLTPEEADAYHANVDTCWEVAGEHFVIYSTLPRVSTDWARWYADECYPDLVRIYGLKPGDVTTPVDMRGPARNLPGVAVFRNVEQYNSFAAGSPDPPRPPAEIDGFSSLHFAFFADAWFDPTTQPPSYRGAGVGFWDTENPNLANFGRLSIRHAAAQSYAEAIDPSWEALGEVLTSQGGQASTASFWAEKRIPRWLRYGAASYVERYFVDSGASEGGGDPMWARNWAFSNLEQAGGVGELDEIFQFELSIQDPAAIEASEKCIKRAGALVCYMLDGDDAKVKTAHQAFQAALRKGEDTEPTVKALEEALKASQKKIEKFCQG